MKKTKKHITLAIIVIIIAALAFGYAYLTTTLSINGITDIDRNSWDVYFDNVQVTDGSVSGAQEIEAPTITSDTEVEFHVNLKKPGDFYEFTIEARNDGTIDAMINSISKKLNNVEITTLPAYLNYKVTYEDDVEIEDNHLLAAESLETYKIRVEYKSNISASDLPSTAQSINLSFGVEYVQADDNAMEIKKTYYSVNTIWDGEIVIGEEVPSGVTLYSNYREALNAFDNVFFFKIELDDNNKVEKAYLGLLYNDTVSYFEATDDIEVYKENLRIAKSILGNGCPDSDSGLVICSFDVGSKGGTLYINEYGYVHGLYNEFNYYVNTPYDKKVYCNDD